MKLFNKKSRYIEVGDNIYPNLKHLNLMCYFKGIKSRKVVRIWDTYNLSYEKRFVYVLINDKEQGFYESAMIKL